MGLVAFVSELVASPAATAAPEPSANAFSFSDVLMDAEASAPAAGEEDTVDVPVPPKKDRPLWMMPTASPSLPVEFLQPLEKPENTDKLSQIALLSVPDTQANVIASDPIANTATPTPLPEVAAAPTPITGIDSRSVTLPPQQPTVFTPGNDEVQKPESSASNSVAPEGGSIASPASEDESDKRKQAAEVTERAIAEPPAPGTKQAASPKTEPRKHKDHIVQADTPEQAAAPPVNDAVPPSPPIEHSRSVPHSVATKMEAAPTPPDAQQSGPVGGEQPRQQITQEALRDRSAERNTSSSIPNRIAFEAIIRPDTPAASEAEPVNVPAPQSSSARVSAAAETREAPANGGDSDSTDGEPQTPEAPAPQRHSNAQNTSFVREDVPGTLRHLRACESNATGNDVCPAKRLRGDQRSDRDERGGALEAHGSSHS
jgi:hypothetical protein